MREREPGLDLLRCAALLCVVTFHSFLNNGYYSESQIGIAMWLAGSLRWLSVSCIGLYLMLTGYLQSEKTEMKSCCRNLPTVVLGYLLACAVSIPVRHFCFADEQSLGTWVRRLFGFSGILYGWYVEMYIGLSLLSPFVNRLLKCMEDSGLLAFAGVMICLTALPGATPLGIAPDYWRGMYPLTYYILGAAVRRLRPKLRTWQGLGGALLTALTLGAATVLSTDGTLSDGFTQEFPDLWILVTVLFLFLGLYHIPCGNGVQRVLKFFSGGCYGGYLLSHLFDGWCYGMVPQWHSPEHYPKIFLFITVPIFIASILLGRLLHGLSTRLLGMRKEAVR